MLIRTTLSGGASAAGVLGAVSGVAGEGAAAGAGDFCCLAAGVLALCGPAVAVDAVCASGPAFGKAPHCTATLEIVISSSLAPAAALPPSGCSSGEALLGVGGACCSDEAVAGCGEADAAGDAAALGSTCNHKSCGSTIRLMHS